MQREGVLQRCMVSLIHLFYGMWGLAGAIKGAVSSMDLKEIGCQIELSNTYHLHVRPGDQWISRIGRPPAFYELGIVPS